MQSGILKSTRHNEGRLRILANYIFIPILVPMLQFNNNTGKHLKTIPIQIHRALTAESCPDLSGAEG